jgi:hypothetical protein
MAEDLGALTGAMGLASIDTTGAAFVCSPREATIIKTKGGHSRPFLSSEN